MDKYKSIADAHDDMKKLGYVIVGKFENKEQMDAYFNFHNKLEERLEASRVSLREFRSKS